MKQTFDSISRPTHVLFNKVNGKKVEHHKIGLQESFGDLVEVTFGASGVESWLYAGHGGLCSSVGEAICKAREIYAAKLKESNGMTWADGY